MRVVFDIETNGLVNPTKVWCVVCKDIDNGKTYTFDGTSPKSVKQLAKLFNDATELIGHNVIGFDLVWLRKLLKIVPNKSCRITDTLVLSRLLEFGVNDGHSLRAWGDRLLFPKYEYDQFETFEQDMLTYCIRDVDVTHSVYLHIMARMKPLDSWEKAIKIEHFIASVCQDMHEDGFPFDITKARELHEEVTSMVADLDSKILPSFPPRSKLIRVVTPKAKKNGSLSRVGLASWYDGDLSVFQPDAPFSLVEWVPFNPASVKQVVERLNESGWKPVERTKGYLEAERERDYEKMKRLEHSGWKVNEVNLATLPADASEGAKLLVKRLMLNYRLTVLNSWFEAYDRTKDGKVHGTFNPIGTWTHRMSHTDPNLGNIAAKKSIKYKTQELSSLATDLGGRMRSLWLCETPKLMTSLDDQVWQVGTDADGIQLRILAHYMDDKDFTTALVSGDSKLGTDAHTLNQKALGVDVCKTRDTAKTFIYAWLLGAGIPKIADILGCTNKIAEEAVKRFIARYPGLKRLKEEVIPRDAKQGYFIGLDGRKVPCSSQHLMLAGYLQNGEVCVMKHATQMWMAESLAQKMRFKLRNLVHDEWQTTVYGYKHEAEHFGKLQELAIERTGTLLKLKCPLKGNHKVGKNWLDTH